MNKDSLINKKLIYIIISVILIAVAVFKLSANKKIVQNKVYHYNIEDTIFVQADTIRLEEVDFGLSYAGTFLPYKETKISSDIQGKISNILVDVGQRVKKGQPLIQLDNALLKLQLQSIEAQIKGLEKDVKRYTVLENADAIQGIQLEKSLLALESSKIQKSIIGEQITKSIIKAPFDGIITAKFNEEGAFAAPGVPLLQLIDISNLKFTANVSEYDIRHFSLDQNFPIIADAYPEVELQGKTIMKSSNANMGSSYPIQFEVINTPDEKLKAGMFGKIYVKDIEKDLVICIPSSSLIGSESHPQVFIIEDGKAHLKNIVLSKKVQNKLIVSSGLKVGNVIVTHGFINLFDGANVAVK